ncbi:hypothetical protein [Nodosilinea nodulosa]|uniref:hypothetical protein n=1 Tax=Nodosilinea nodulosa TaxID=416001 RepID=UPI0002F70655|nr:hypothetical protein [Nodosilinea nodulosa]
MQLSCLGQPYAASVPTVEAIPSLDTFVFLGVSYPGKQLSTTTQPRSAEALTYRGHRYSR